jgi:hypothetical protein
VKTTETALHHCHAPDEVQALHNIQPDSSDSSIRMLVAMENGLIQEHALPFPAILSEHGQVIGSTGATDGSVDSALRPAPADHSDGGWAGGQLPAAISHDVATLRRTPRVTVKGLRHMGQVTDDVCGVVGGSIIDEGGLWSLELTLQTLSKIALVNRSIGVDIIVHSSHPEVVPQVVQIDREGLLPQECVQRLYQMFVETASMAAVTNAQQCLHMCCTMMLQVGLLYHNYHYPHHSHHHHHHNHHHHGYVTPQVIDAAVEALDESILKNNEQCVNFHFLH